MRLIDNTLLSPFFVFIKATSQFTDESLMARLRLNNYQSLTMTQMRETCPLDMVRIYLTEDKEWIHLIDDWTYSLWFDSEFRKDVLMLSKDFEILCCYIGDVDESFGFWYMKDGKILREYIVEDPDFKGGRVTIDKGNPLNKEAESLGKTDNFEKIVSIAKGMGVDTNHTKEKIRCYQRPERKEEKFHFNEGEY